MKKYYEGYKRRSFVYAMLDLFDNPEYNHQEFIKKLSYQTTKLVDVPRAEDYLQIIDRSFEGLPRIKSVANTLKNKNKQCQHYCKCKKSSKA